MRQSEIKIHAKPALSFNSSALRLKPEIRPVMLNLYDSLLLKNVGRSIRKTDAGCQQEFFGGVDDYEPQLLNQAFRSRHLNDTVGCMLHSASEDLVVGEPPSRFIDRHTPEA